MQNSKKYMIILHMQDEHAEVLHTVAVVDAVSKQNKMIC